MGRRALAPAGGAGDDGVPYEEMAAIHGLSANLAGVRLHRARRLLATKLKGEER